VLNRWEHVFNSCNDLSKWAGLPEYKTPERFFLFLRKLLHRARPSIREVAYLHGFLSLIENLVPVVSKVERDNVEDGD
jgi:tRNA C32,U32 (ribose-2'-O)-methylase TrmJ